MKFKDIVNRDIITLTNCENEPIHIPGSIQPHGFLLGVTAHNWKIDYCSANISDYFDISHTQVLGKFFSEIFGFKSEELLKSYINHDGLGAALPFDLVIQEKYFQFTIHKSDDIYILEAEIHATDKEKLADIYTQTIQFVSYMNNTRTLKELCGLVAEGTRNITGYDRVMIYRFDKDYNGEVYAESCREDIEPFLGLHYPHTDIPVQARELYMKNLLRLIVDIEYKPIPLFTVDDADNKNLDLSLSILRSTSPIHVEYLKNIGVGATLTISLIHQDRLWGLIACHHYGPKNLTPEVRLAAQLQGQFITSQISVRQSNEEYDIARKTNLALEKLNGLNLPPIFESFKIISLNPELLTVCNALGVSILVSDRLYTNGLTPTADVIKKLSSHFAAESNDTHFHTTKLIDDFPEAKKMCEEISGIIYHSLGNDNSIIWYRPETLAEVNWAGDPDKAIIRDNTGLHPRNSFDLWKQIIKCQSNPWLQPERNAAANYAHALQKQISLTLLSSEEEKYRNLNEILKEANSELENINWISTHDLQEPLRKIQMSASRLLEKEKFQLEDGAVGLINLMDRSANRMQRLITDIMKFTRLKHAETTFEIVDLDVVLSETLEELDEVIKEKSAIIIRDTLPTIDGIPFLIKQLFSNIILNSLKYASSERPLVIKITTTKPKRNLILNNSYSHPITFADNGIGFEQQYSESIFKMLTRLHKVGEYSGSGIGLALCKKIMQLHNGYIAAKGQSEIGAEFTIYFPIKDESR